MAWLSTLHLFTQVTVQMSYKVCRMHPYNQHHTSTTKSFSHLFGYLLLLLLVVRYFNRFFKSLGLLTQGFLVGGACISSSLLLSLLLLLEGTNVDVTTTATRRDQCRWFTGASKVRSNIHINENSLLNY